MINNILLVSLLLLVIPETGLASETDAAVPPPGPAISQSVRVWKEIKALRQMTENGIIPELEARGLVTGLSDETKWRIVRDIGTSEEFNNIGAEKLNDTIALLQCLRGHPIEKATIKPECEKDGRIDRLIAHAEALMRREDRIFVAAAGKYR